MSECRYWVGGTGTIHDAAKHQPPPGRRLLTYEEAYEHSLREQAYVRRYYDNLGYKGD